MPDRLALPHDRREACRACDSTKGELTQCPGWNCGTDICSDCAVTMRFDDLGVLQLCNLCAAKYRNEAGTYGHQNELEAA